MSAAQADLTGRARLRDAAIEAFAARGFDESLRAIAARAHVTAGLVRHHFGSKEALRAECDAVVLTRYRTLKTRSLHQDPRLLFTHLPNSRDSGILMLYILRSVHDGGQAGADFVAQVTEDSRGFLADAVARGIVVPSRDEPARLRYLILQALGALVLYFALHPPPDPEDFASVMEAYYRDIALPTLELYTEGLFTGTEYLDMYLAADPVAHPPAGTAGDAVS